MLSLPLESFLSQQVFFKNAKRCSPDGDSDGEYGSDAGRDCDSARWDESTP